MEVTHKALNPGVELICVTTDKFKTGCLSVSLLCPLERDTATATALVGDVLYRGSEAHPDMEALCAAQDELYGMTLAPSVRQRGESQCVSLVGGFIDDKYALDGQAVLEPAAALLGEVLLRPVTDGGVFLADYVAGEGANLADLIRAQVNEKRGWSIRRLAELMCAGERYAIDKYGFAEEAQAMTPEALWARYRQLLKDAPVVLCYVGSAPPRRVEDAVRAAFDPLLTPRQTQAQPCQVVAAPAGEVREHTEHMDVTQGKLALGLRTGGVDLHSPMYPALLVCNAMYGGTATSRLFMNVREKLSLCYFADSMVDKYKGIMVVSSGVEFDKFQVARAEILAQLNQLQRGQFTGEEFRAARQAVSSSLRTLLDSQGRLEDFWFSQAVAGVDESPEALIARVESVDEAGAAQAASMLSLDTVYCLSGKEE